MAVNAVRYCDGNNRPEVSNRRKFEYLICRGIPSPRSVRVVRCSVSIAPECDEQRNDRRQKHHYRETHAPSQIHLLGKQPAATDVHHHTKTLTMGGPFLFSSAEGAHPGTTQNEQSIRRRLVEQQPIHAQFAYGRGEAFKVHWLHDVTVNAEVVTLDHVSLLPR
jgi:hypothetical protein